MPVPEQNLSAHAPCRTRHWKTTKASNPRNKAVHRTDTVKLSFGWLLNVVRRPEGNKGFLVLPKRWIVERTFAWFMP